MDQALATRRKEFNEAVEGFGLDKDAAESLWSYASSVGMQIESGGAKTGHGSGGIVRPRAE